MLEVRCVGRGEGTTKKALPSKCSESRVFPYFSMSHFLMGDFPFKGFQRPKEI